MFLSELELQTLAYMPVCKNSYVEFYREEEFPAEEFVEELRTEEFVEEFRTEEFVEEFTEDESTQVLLTHTELTQVGVRVPQTELSQQSSGAHD